MLWQKDSRLFKGIILDIGAHLPYIEKVTSDFGNRIVQWYSPVRRTSVNLKSNPTTSVSFVSHTSFPSVPHPGVSW